MEELSIRKYVPMCVVDLYVLICIVSGYAVHVYIKVQFHMHIPYKNPSQQQMVTSGKIQEFAEPVEIVEGGEIVRKGGGDKYRGRGRNVREG